MTKPYIVTYLLAGPALSLAGHWSVGQLWLPPWLGFILPTFGFFAILFLGPYVLADACVKAFRARWPSRRATWVGIVAVLLGLLLGVATMRAGLRLRIAGYHHLAIQLTPVVEAIRSFEAANARPPSSLDELVPNFIAALPAGTERVAYEREGTPCGWELHGNPWILRSNAQWGSGFDSFVYFPNQQYPAHMFRGRPEPVGDWVYVHE